jgi:hypothetical protein
VINRAPTARQQRRAALDEQIKRLSTASGGIYGSPRITDDLREAGWKISANTVAARMVELGPAGRPPNKRRSLTRPGRRPAAPDLADLARRNFTAIAPDVLWCGDVTQIDTGEGPLYLATTEDLFSRGMLGHAMSAHHDATLVVASLQMAATLRGGDVDGVIFHTDRGSEYTAAKTAAACRALGVTQSMAGSGAHSTTPPPRRSTARSRSSSPTGRPSRPGPRPASKSQPGSPTSTTPTGDTPRTTGSPRPHSNVKWQKHGEPQRPSSGPKWHKNVPHFGGIDSRHRPDPRAPTRSVRRTYEGWLRTTGPYAQRVAVGNQPLLSRGSWVCPAGNTAGCGGGRRA